MLSMHDRVLALPQHPLLPGAAALQEAMVAVLLHAGEGTHTERAYRRALRDFFAWYDSQRDHEGRYFPLRRALLLRYRAHLTDERHLTASSINQRLAPIRRLALELSLIEGSGMSAADAAAFAGVAGVKQRGQRLGNWLDQQQIDAVVNLPNRQTLKRLRDRAILVTLIGSGLRRYELAALTVEQIQLREGRWMLVDIEGKHHKVRSVPINATIYVAIRAWLERAQITSGPVFRPVNRGNRVTAARAMTPQAVRDVVKYYVSQLELDAVAPHDLRRTFAKHAYENGVPLEQIQLSLGHESIEHTAKYIGKKQDLRHAPSDAIVMHLEE